MSDQTIHQRDGLAKVRCILVARSARGALIYRIATLRLDRDMARAYPVRITGENEMSAVYAEARSIEAAAVAAGVSLPYEDRCFVRQVLEEAAEAEARVRNGRIMSHLWAVISAAGLPVLGALYFSILFPSDRGSFAPAGAILGAVASLLMALHLMMRERISTRKKGA